MFLDDRWRYICVGGRLLLANPGGGGRGSGVRRGVWPPVPANQASFPLKLAIFRPCLPSALGVLYSDAHPQNLTPLGSRKCPTPCLSRASPRGGGVIILKQKPGGRWGRPPWLGGRPPPPPPGGTGVAAGRGGSDAWRSQSYPCWLPLRGGGGALSNSPRKPSADHSIPQLWSVSYLHGENGCCAPAKSTSSGGWLVRWAGE